MFVAVLICSPDRPVLTPERADALCQNWQGGSVRWLSEGTAAEFDLAETPMDLWAVWEALQTEAIDLAVVPKEGRRKALLLADMDSTMIQQECVDELAEMAGVGDRVREITARAMNGELDFEEALDARVSLLAGLPESIVDEVLDTRITEMPGGRTLLATMRANGSHAALVSGGFTAFTGPVSDRIGFHEHRANVLLAEDGKLTGAVARPILGRAAKVAALEDLTKRLAINASDVIAVGDGANDLGMLERAGMGVALHAKPSVAAACDLRINHGDLTSLLFLQGYSAGDVIGTV